MLSLTRLLLLSPALLVDRLPLPLNPLFHYPAPLGYWNRPSHDFFVAGVTDGFGAFSADYGGASAD